MEIYNFKEYNEYVPNEFYITNTEYRDILKYMENSELYKLNIDANKFNL